MDSEELQKIRECLTWQEGQPEIPVSAAASLGLALLAEVERLQAEVETLRSRRIPIGAKDRNGVEVCLGDTVRFADRREWGSGKLPENVVELKGGKLHGVYTPSDLRSFCEVVKRGGGQ